MPVGIERLSAAQKRSLAAALMVLLTLGCYWPAFHAGFIWDDDTSLTANPLIKSASGLRDIWFSTRPYDYFPLTFTSFWIEWRLWGMEAAGYHLANVLLHAASAVLLWRVLLRLRIPVAWLAATAFAVHPVCVASVAWITERKNTLSMFFCLLSVLWFLKSDERDSSEPNDQALTPRFYWLSLGAFALALLSKTSVVTLPFILLLCMWWQRRQASPDFKFQIAGPARASNFKFGMLLPFLALSLLFGLLTVWFQSHRAMGGEHLDRDPLLVRLLGGSRALWFYLWKAVAPLNLSMIYPRWKISPRIIGAYLPALLFAALLLICWKFRRSWGAAPFFALACFLFLLLPVLGFFDMYFLTYSQAADHWQYLALIPIITLIVAGVAHVSRFTFHGSRIAVSVLVLAALSFLTFQQARIYRSQQTLWRDTLAKNRRAWPACNNLGNAAADPQEALGWYEATLKINPHYAPAHNNIGAVLAAQGKFEEAILRFREAIRQQPGYAHAHNNLGSALLDLKRVSEAISEFELALQIDANYPDAHNNLGRALAVEGKVAEAVSQFNDALRLNPDYPEAHFNLGNALLSQGKVNQALPHYLSAVSKLPNYAEAHYQAGVILLSAKRIPEAMTHLRETVRLKPDWVEALNNLAWLLATQNQSQDGAEAVLLATRAVELTGTNNAGALDTLAAAYAQNSEFTRAVDTATRALGLAAASGQSILTNQIASHISAYKSSRPFHE